MGTADWAAIFAIIGGGIATSTWFVRFGLKIHRLLSRVETAVAYVEAELRFDGGQSTRDAIARIEHRVDDIQRELCKHVTETRRNPPA